MLNEVKQEILCVRGNCDTEVDQMVLEFPILAEYCILPSENTGHSGDVESACDSGHLFIGGF